jgi:hypothetical protein
VTVTVARSYPSAAVARRIADAVSADNPPFVRVEATGADLTIRLEARSAGSARATLDDLLACLQAAERADPGT